MSLHKYMMQKCKTSFAQNIQRTGCLWQYFVETAADLWKVWLLWNMNLSPNSYRQVEKCVFLTLPYPLLTTWDRFRLEEPTVPQPVKQFPALDGTRKFFAAFTRSRHLTLSWAKSNQCKLSQPIFWTHILILSSHLHLGLQSCLFPLGFGTKNPIPTSSIPHSCHMPYSSLSFRFDTRIICYDDVLSWSSS